MKKHPRSDIAISILFQERKGRYVVANKPFCHGETVLEEESYAFVVSDRYLEVLCAYCGKNCADGVVYCVSSDDSSRYCSEHCIRYDYPVHVIEIDALKDIRKGFAVEGGERARLIMRIAAIRKREESLFNVAEERDLSLPTLGRSNRFSDVRNLCAAKTSAMGSTALVKAATGLSNIAKFSKMQLSPDDAEFLLLAIECNAHQILSARRDYVALGLFPMTSMLNHSCVPNCAHDFEIVQGRSPRVVMRAIRDILAGEELCYSYVPLYDSTAGRRALLEQAYSFRCDCSRCEGCAEDDVLSMWVKRREGCTGDEARDYVSVSMLDGADLPARDVKEALEDRLQCCIVALAAFQDNASEETTGPLLTAFDALISVVNTTLLVFSSRLPRGVEAPAQKDPVVPHPAHRLLLGCYAALARAGEALASHYSALTRELDSSIGHRDHDTVEADNNGDGTRNTSNLDGRINLSLAGLCTLETMDTLVWSSLRFGLLAVGCVAHYTNVRMTELLELQGIVAGLLRVAAAIMEGRGPSILDDDSNPELQTEARSDNVSLVNINSLLHYGDKRLLRSKWPWAESPSSSENEVRVFDESLADGTYRLLVFDWQAITRRAFAFSGIATNATADTADAALSDEQAANQLRILHLGLSAPARS